MAIIKSLEGNKRAQIPTTLTWFVGFLIVFFVMLMFIFFTLLSVSMREIDVGSLEYNSETLESQRNLIVFLNSPLEVGGKEMRVLDWIFSSLDPYFEIHNGNENLADERLIDWAYQYYSGAPDSLEKIDLLKAELRGFNLKEMNEIGRGDREFGKELSKELDVFCNEYYLQIPQGVVRPGGLITKKALGSKGYRIFDNTEDKLMVWTSTMDLHLPYRGKNFEIKYRRLRVCENEDEK